MKRTKSLKFRTVLFAIVSMLVVIFLTVLGCGIFNKKFYKKNAQQHISQEAEKLKLSFISKVNKEIALSEKMVTSPVIREYMKDPSSPEWKSAGLQELRSYESSFKSKLSFWISDKDKQYFANCEPKYILDVNDPKDSWYLLNLNASGNYSFYVDYEKSLKATFLWINGIVRDENGTPLGLAGTGIPISDFINEIYTELDPNYEMYMFNSGMEVSAARNNQKLIDDKTLIQKIFPLAQIPDKIPSETIMVSAADGEYIISPINDIGWGLVIKCPLNVKSIYANSINVLGYIVIFISASIILVFYLFIIRITKEIKYVLGALSSSIEEIENGEADLTKRMLTSSQDELGEMIYEYNKFIEKLQQIVADIKHSEQQLNSVGNGLNIVISGTSETMYDILEGIENSEKKVTVQNSSVTNTTLEIEKISANIESLEQLITQQSEGVDNAFRSVRAMIENIDSVNKSVEDMAGSFGDLKEKTRSGSAKQTDVNERIKEVENQSRMLQDANQAISNIAEQTNLLAMNAAIEAAHAGEVGKGFSVVADEIRKLSETSGAQSKTIGDQLEKIRESIQSVVQTSEESRKSFDQVYSEISCTDEIVQGIRLSMNQQQDMSHQIGNILEEITSSTSRILNASREMSGESSVINQEIVQLMSATKDISESIRKMSGGAGKIKEDGEHLVSISSNVNGAITQISGQVGKFKV